jgi:nitrite reductase/ring-hydroxylating ferredoxin subunit
MSAQETIGDAQWFPIANSDELPFRHVYHAELLGQELAVWRADDGFVNVWENRCLHRGVRLSLGLNLGAALKCQYHGWTYSSRTSGCTYIPAHPENAPARLICNKVYPSIEHHGFVWSCLKTDADPSSFAPPGDREGLVIRSLPFGAAASAVTAALKQDRDLSLAPAGPFALRSAGNKTAFYIQPVDDHRCIVRGIVYDVADDAKLTMLHDVNGRLSRLRTVIEIAPGDQP